MQFYEERTVGSDSLGLNKHGFKNPNVKLQKHNENNIISGVHCIYTDTYTLTG